MIDWYVRVIFMALIIGLIVIPFIIFISGCATTPHDCTVRTWLLVDPVIEQCAQDFITVER